jgi:type IV secretion system protein VirB9
MSLRLLAMIILIALCGCVTTQQVPDAPFDQAIPAKVEPEPARPVQLVQVPQLLPLPGQLKRSPEGTAPDASSSNRSESPKEDVSNANTAARIEPSFAGYINAMQVWPYSPAALYQIYTSPGKVTDIVLEAGEQVTDVSISDSVRWVVGDTKSGTGASAQTHLIVKPTRVDLKANLVITTDRRTYYAELKSEPETWMASVSWDYPNDRLHALKVANQQRESIAPVATGVQLEQLKFRYEITGDNAPWKPVRAFDDGFKVYIQFPDGIAQGTMPPLFILGPYRETQLVNYRVRSPYYIVDRLFGAAELRMGGGKAQVVRITRTDLAKGSRAGDHP